MVINPETPIMNTFIIMFVALILSMFISGLCLIVTYFVAKTRLKYIMPDIYFTEKEIKIV